MKLSGRRISISKKLTWANVLVSGAALLLSGAAFVWYGTSVFRDTMLSNLSAQAKIIGANSVSAIVFNDPKAAESTLSALSAAPNVISAVIYTLDGQQLAKYSRGVGAPGLELQNNPMPPGETEAYWSEAGEIVLARLITFENKAVGIVYVRSDLEDINALFRRFLLIAVIVLAASLLAARLVSTRFHRGVAEPIERLAGVAQTVSREKNYSVRAPAANSEDEVAILILAFNEMLQTIQEHEKALKNAQERMNLALRSSGVGTWSWDLVTGKIEWDEYLYPLFGIKPGTFSGSYEAFESYLHPDDRKRVARQFAESVERDMPLDCQYRVLRPDDGSVHILSVRGKVYRDGNGKPLSMTGVCWDISELKQAEQELSRLNEELEQRVTQRTLELQSSNKELEAFTYSVAHDLRAPLRHIHGFSKLLVEEFGSSMDPTASDYLRDILEGAANMGRLIDDLLALGRVSRQELKLAITGLGPLVEEVIRSLRTETKNRNILWKVDQLPFAECDPGLMKVVFANLLSNAVKYSSPRDPAIIEVGHTTLNGERVIYVRDNGVGFNEKYASKLFGIFQRLHRQEDFEGTGVGLATVQRILHRHHGRIWAKSEVEKGATFYFTTGGSDKDENTHQNTLQHVLAAKGES